MWEYNNTLCHYGVLGMKWGRRKKRATADTNEDLDTRKKRILESRDPKTIYKNKDLFTKNELIEAYQIMNVENNIKNLIPKQVSKGERYVDNAIKWGNKVSNLASTSVNVYNNVSKFMNTFGVKSPDASNLKSVTDEINRSSNKQMKKQEKQKQKESRKQTKSERYMEGILDEVKHSSDYGRSYVDEYSNIPVSSLLND